MGTIEDFCPECEEMTTRRIEQRVENHMFRGESIALGTDVAVCNTCGHDIADPTVDDITLNRVYVEYRRRHNIITPEEIAELIVQCGLSQRAFGRLLDVGDITIHRYLHGQIPSGFHNKMLRSLQDSVVRYRFLKAQRDQLDEADARKVDKIIAQGRESVANTEIGDGIHRLMRGYNLEDRGNRDFDLQRFAQVALFFLQGQSQSRVQLLKDLFYSDFLAYKRFLRSLTGTPYCHYPYGPVPVHYARLLGELEDSGVIAMDASEYTVQGELRNRFDYRAMHDFSSSIFLREEMDVLHTVRCDISCLTARQASTRSHAEDAWGKTSEGQIISYATYAPTLRLD